MVIDMSVRPAVPAANGHALDFYKSAGFVLDEEIDLEFGRGYRMHLACAN
jgi:hypothetical protein